MQASASKLMAGPSASYNGFDDTDENTRLYFFYCLSRISEKLEKYVIVGAIPRYRSELKLLCCVNEKSM